MRRALLLAGLGLGLAGLGVLLGFIFLARPSTGPAVEPGSGRALYLAHCATCHGESGRGDSWRAWLLLLRPGDLTDPERMRALSDQYLFDIIKHGGSSFGKPGMPSSGYHLIDDEVRALVAYIRSLSTPSGLPPGEPEGPRPRRPAARGLYQPPKRLSRGGGKNTCAT